jgi:sec-independent protein translocase protein TatA
MFGLGLPEIIVIGIIILLIFGAKRLPSIGEGLGRTVKELRNVKREINGVNKPEAKKAVDESHGSEEKIETAGDETGSSEGRSSESDIVDTIQKKVTDQVADKLLRQFPGIKQAKQLKDKADKIKKIVS